MEESAFPLLEVTVPRAAARLALACAFLPLLAACGGSSGTAASKPTPAPVQTTPDATTAKAGIGEAYATFFGGKGAATDIAAALENGDQFVTDITKSMADAKKTGINVAVRSVQVVDTQHANVVYDMTDGKGAKLLTGAQGGAVLQDGRWKVSRFTYCQLLGLQDPSVQRPQCK